MAKKAGKIKILIAVFTMMTVIAITSMMSSGYTYAKTYDLNAAAADEISADITNAAAEEKNKDKDTLEEENTDKKAKRKSDTVLKHVYLDEMTIRAQWYSSNTDYMILVNCTEHRIGLYHWESGSWKVVYIDYCGDGAPGMETPTGEFTIYDKLYYFDTDTGNCRCFYACRFYGSYLLHSTLYARTETPQVCYDDRRGMGLSHGCVRVELGFIKYIYDNCPYGTKVVIYR